MELISDYMRDDTYRHMLNELAQKTQGGNRNGTYRKTERDG